MIIVKIISNPYNRNHFVSSSQFLGDGILHQGRIPRSQFWRPPTDVFECEKEYVVRVEIAGMGEDAFSITLDQNLLIIRGMRNETADRIAFHQMEVRFGEFVSTVELPNNIDAGSASAEYKNGFLQVFLPKKYPKSLEIEE
jgi:HSP20 family protein